jgi:hypothetical protein
MTIAEPIPNHAAREFSWRTRALKRQLRRAEDLNAVAIRDQLAAAIGRCERGEVSSAEASALAEMARLALDLVEGH